MTVRTNNVPRDIIEADTLTAAEQEKFDYLDWPKIKSGDDSASFVRYQGELYDLGEFMRVEKGGELDQAGWQGYAASAWSAIVIRYTDDHDAVVVGHYYSE